MLEPPDENRQSLCVGRKRCRAEGCGWFERRQGVRHSLYSFNAVAYESLMLGVMEIIYNTPGDNGDCEKVGLPKQTGLHFCFSRDDCAAFSRNDSTKAELRFKGGDLSSLAGRPVRFRFLIHCGTLYSFWVSPSERGESCGYVAGGGPAYKGLRDL